MSVLWCNGKVTQMIVKDQERQKKNIPTSESTSSKKCSWRDWTTHDYVC